MALKILQWNLNGFYNNLHELQLLIQNNSPDIIALQETHHGTNSIRLNGYNSILSKNRQSSRSSTALFVKNNLTYSSPTFNNFYTETDIGLGSKVKIISLYLNPSEPLPITELTTIFTNFNTRTIILGDFNSHSTLWGSTHTNQRGLAIENLLTNSNFVILNDGSPTHLSTRSTLTHIDLSLVSADLVPYVTWNIDSHLHSSDHFPIFIDLTNLIPTNTIVINTKQDLTSKKQNGPNFKIF